MIVNRCLAQLAAFIPESLLQLQGTHDNERIT